MILISALKECKDPFLLELSKQSGETMFRMKLPSDIQFHTSLEGPDRKKYTSYSVKHKEQDDKYTNFWFDINEPTFYDEILKMSYMLSKTNINELKSPNLQELLEQIDGPGINYIKICQSIYREININAMRTERRKNFILRPTGVNGLYLLIYPGPKLRTGENLSIIWFKLLILRENLESSKHSNSWIFKTFQLDGIIYHSRWLSTDANRLDHYIRCYDRVMMAYFAYIHSTRTASLLEGVRDDKSNVLGIIIMIYMENKRSTSKMLQDVRYLVMNLLSLFKYRSDLSKKFQDPLRTPFQAYLLKKIIEFADSKDMVENQFIKTFQLGKFQMSHSPYDYSDKYTGSLFEVPRILTNGPEKIIFPQALCEMYFTMLFNKNQDDPTHASFQILDKMLEGEASLQEIKNSTKLHTGGSLDHNHDLNIINEIIDNPHKNQFHANSVILGAKLQSISQYNSGPLGLAQKKAAGNKFIDKTLDEFATYKSSSVCDNKFYNEKIGMKQQESLVDYQKRVLTEGKDDNDGEIKEYQRQNPRRRCIEGIIELLNDGKETSFDIIKQTLFEDHYFQIFKKNQIGGVREILILPIDKRILINILESYSRLICKEDDREMLTHGDKKFVIMRDMIRDMRRKDDKRIILNYNFDKSRWGPSFMPIQFLYMFLPFKNIIPELFRLLAIILINHTNKKCLYPEKLIRAWIKDPLNRLAHRDANGLSKNLQHMKEKFLHDKSLFFINESNMGQGILHYTSSLHHLCMISLRDEIYKRLCTRSNITPGDWRDIISSDDSYTAQSLPMDGVNRVRLRINLFIKAQEVSERVFNMWTSTSKSSISFVISEFNSLFGSNMTMYPTLLKFAIASVNPVNTDSFFRMVKESYNTCRQIVENGGSLELFMCAHYFNKLFCESIYHTNQDGVNDPGKLGIRREYCPYQLGIYPIGNPAIMLMLGPELHNYHIMNNMESLTDMELNLFNNCHTLVEVSDLEVFAELNNFDNLFVGLCRIEAAMGPIRKLQAIRRKVPISWEEIKNYIEENPLLMFRKPQNLHEIKIKTYLKLYQYGSAEALRTTAASIYYARVSATVSAKSFEIPYSKQKKAEFERIKGKIITKAFTYHECLQYLIEKKDDKVPYERYYPYMNEYKNLILMSSSYFNYNYRDPLETMNVRQLQLNEVTVRIKNPLNELLTHFWVHSQNVNDSDHPNSFKRDWINLKRIVPILRDTLNLTLDQLAGTKSEKIRSLIVILLRLTGYNSRPMKAIVYGPSTRTYDQTYVNLMQFNRYQQLVGSDYSKPIIENSKIRAYDKLYMIFNYYILYYKIHNTHPDIGHLMNSEDIDLYCTDASIPINSKKKILMMLLLYNKIDDVTLWTERTGYILHNWIKKQKKNDDGKYYGDFSLKLQLGSVIMCFEKRKRRYAIFLNSFKNDYSIYSLLERALELTDTSKDVMMNNIKKGKFMYYGDKIISSHVNVGFHMYAQRLSNVVIDAYDISVGDELISLLDSESKVIMNTPIGLLASDYDDRKLFYNFDCFGVKFHDLIKNHAFSVNFKLEDLSEEILVDMIESLELSKPKISIITKERLRLPNDWEERDEKDEFSTLEQEMLPSEGLKGDFILDAIDLLDSNIDEFKNEAGIMLQDNSMNDIDIWLSSINISNLISQTKEIGKTFQPYVIWKRIIGLKYSIISCLCISTESICKQAISLIFKMTQDVNLKYALIHTYDHLFTNTDIKSPPFIAITFSKPFLNKFFPELIDD